ncbi:hypothetical protein RUM44_009285 [Polyplax serrata]|uniref:IC97/Casc1 N-terminal domain-containing protein n=1 Tax=Polyplax serrata TaxID=468196 RepID=A0ABR1ASH8_POLSC
MGPKKKKMSKKERQRLADEYKKIKKAQMEQERLKLLREEKERIEREKKLAQEKIKREIVEQEVRQRELGRSCQLFRNLQNNKKELEKEIREQYEWTQYLKCDGLPDPNSFSEMNTYLYLWKKNDTNPEIEKVLDKTEEVLNLLTVLDDLIIDSPFNATPSHIEEWKKIRKDLRCEQQKRLDLATHKLLRNIETNLEAIDMTTSKYTLESRHFTLNLWNKTLLPISVAGANEVKQSFTLDFPNIGVSLLLPAAFYGTNMAVRALWLKYDHISDSCRTWDCPPVPDSFLKDLNEITLEEWQVKTKLQRQFDEYEKSIENATVEELITNKPKKTIPELMTEMEENQINEWKKKMTIESVQHEVNLRKFSFLGGVFYLDLIEQPPQPRQLAGKRVVTLLNTPEGLNSIPYYEHYIPPPPPEPGARRTPEEIEVEVKKQEQALEKLAAVTVAEEPEKPKMPAEDLKREMEKEKELQKLVVVTVE